MALLPIDGVIHASLPSIPVFLDSVSLREPEVAGQMRGFQRIKKIDGLPPAVFRWNGARPNSRQGHFLITALSGGGGGDCVDPDPRPTTGILYP